MPYGSEFQTEGAAMLKQQEAKCGPGEPTTDWRSVENVQESGNYEKSGGKLSLHSAAAKATPGMAKINGNLSLGL